MYILTKVEEAFCPETYFYSNANVGIALRDIKDALKYHANCEEDIFRIAKNLPDGESYESAVNDSAQFRVAKYRKRIDVEVAFHNHYGEVEQVWKLTYVNPNKYKN